MDNPSKPMSESDFILAAGGRPFRDRDAASLKAIRMAADLADNSFRVVEHPQGGYAVARGETPMDAAVVEAKGAPELLAPTNAPPPRYEVPEAPADVLARETDESRAGRVPPVTDDIGGVVPPVRAHERCAANEPGACEHLAEEGSLPAAAKPRGPVQTLSDFTGGFPKEFALNVAPRAFVQLHILTILGFALMLFPHWLLAPLGGFVGFQDPALGASVLGGIRLGAMTLGICALSRFLYTYLLYRYVVTPDSVEANFGFIARDAPKVFFAHIRTTKVMQSWWQRLLVVGDVALGTGATDQHEVVLKHISNPKKVEQELERRYLPFIRSAHHRPMD